MDNKSHVFRQLSKLRGSKTLIVGIGNTLKGDDGAGSVVCQELAGKISADLIDAGTVPENYIIPIIKKAPDNLLIIDAIDFSAPPGRVNIFKPDQLSNLIISTHTLSPRLFIDMICQDIKPHIYFIGIQPAHTQLGQTISAEVSDAMKWLEQKLSEIFPSCDMHR